MLIRVTLPDLSRFNINFPTTATASDSCFVLCSDHIHYYEKDRLEFIVLVDLITFGEKTPLNHQ